VRRRHYIKNLLAKKRNLYLARFLLFGSVFLVGLVIIEYSLRLAHPDYTFGVTQEVTPLRNIDHFPGFMIDPEFGFRPIFDDIYYSKYGTLVNEYNFSKSPERNRLLFIGDSVTARGQIISALRRIYGDKHYEYWNAGVESYDTVQEFYYYIHYNHSIHPDHVILTFVLNDFQTTPIVFRTQEGQVVVHAPERPIKPINGWLFKKSYIYRYILGYVITKDSTSHAAISNEMRLCLKRLRDILEPDGIKLTVLISPILRSPDQWPRQYQQDYMEIRTILSELNISYFDLTVPMMKAIADGVRVEGEPIDRWHPNSTVARYFADYLYEKQIFEIKP
jgi:hypothetical protein